MYMDTKRVAEKTLPLFLLRCFRIGHDLAGFDNDGMSGFVAQALLLRRGPDKDGAKQIDKEAVDDAQQVADDRSRPADGRSIFVYHFQTKCFLAKRGAAGGFHNNVVKQGN